MKRQINLYCTIKLHKTPAAMAEPITPDELHAMACMSMYRKIMSPILMQVMQSCLAPLILVQTSSLWAVTAVPG